MGWPQVGEFEVANVVLIGQDGNAEYPHLQRRPPASCLPDTEKPAGPEFLAFKRSLYRQFP